MRRKLLFSVILLGISMFASLRPAAGALPYCDSWCPGKTATTQCSCPPGSHLPGKVTTCGAWHGACWLN